MGMVQRKLEHNADVNKGDKGGGTALHWAAGNGHEAVVRLLLEHNADVNITSYKNGRTALHLGALNGHEAVVQLLLEHNADINICDTYGVTALHLEAGRG